VFAEVSLPLEHQVQAAGYGVHPALLDACLHGALLDRVDQDADRPALPFAWSGVELFATGAFAARVRIAPDGDGGVTVRVADAAGRPLAAVDTLEMRDLPAPQAASGVGRWPEGLYRIDWRPLADGAAGATNGAAGNAAAGGFRVLDADAPDLAGLGDPVPPAVLVPVPGGSVEEAVTGALDLVRRWLADDRFADARLVFALAGDEPAQAAVGGLVRTAQTEHPGRFVLAHVSGDPEYRATAEAVAASDEPEIRVAGGRVTVPRLARPARGALSLPAEGPWRVDVAPEGSQDIVAAVPAPEAVAPLPAGHVRVAMGAAGLNFRDVIVSLGMVPGLEGVGPEGAGTVVETGPGVTGLAVGDRVMGLLPHAMAPVAVADARTVTRMPAGWTFEQGASVPVAFLTAWIGLIDEGRLARGERILIHAATGGLGLAALQLARHVGAEVFATASPAKHHLLRELGLDEDHIASSRDLGFRDRFLAATGGEGMDVVMNSLAGEFTDASLELLPRGGRFVEMGKTDVRAPEAVAANRPGVTYLYFDLLSEGPDRVRGALDVIAGLLTDGTLRPPRIETFDLHRAPEAFDTMRNAGHLGKIVLTLPRRLDPSRTVLITGGTGTLGGLLARHLVTEHGVRHLVLASRRGSAADGAAELAAELGALGAEVSVAACDAGDREALRKLLAGIPSEHSVGTVIHAAGLLDDATVEALTAERTLRVLRAKVRAAEYLDELTDGLDLDAFVLFSSVAGVLGTAGQANYAAANAALDAVARRRRLRGRPAVSLAWGLWRRASGMTGHLAGQDVGRLARTGVAPLDSADGLALFDAALAIGAPALVAARLDMPGLREQAAAGELPAVFRGLVGAGRRQTSAAAAGTAAGGTGGDETALERQLADASPEERERVLLGLVRSHAALVLRHGTARDIAPNRPFREVGFDSLTVVELRNRLNAATGLRLPSTVIFRHPTPALLTSRLHADLFPAGEGSGAPSPADVLGDLDRLRTTLLGIPDGDGAREAAAERLRELLGELDATGAGGLAEDPDLMPATDDEMFALIDKELGIE
jgi:NADPH:quinone reductase-like Zn-dependent oxidoreductase